MRPFTNLTPTDIANLFETWGEGELRATLVARAIYRDGLDDWAKLQDIHRALKDRLATQFYLPRLALKETRTSHDGTKKFVFQLSDGLLIETVLIPEVGSKKQARALCLSTQAGCAMGCTFCYTGLMGLKRNLETWEIIEQVREVTRQECVRPTHLVFMGMGEPLHNFDALKSALDILVSHKGFAFAHRKITVSTVGLLPQMQVLSKMFNVQIAISLHAASDALRQEIVPMTRRFGVEALVDFMREFPRNQQTRFMVEYVLLDGINNDESHAQALAQLLSGIRCQINLIPFNAAPGLTFQRPKDGGIDNQNFLNILRAAGLQSSLRRSRGTDILGACGQLSGLHKS